MSETQPVLLHAAGTVNRCPFRLMQGRLGCSWWQIGLIDAPSHLTFECIAIHLYARKNARIYINNIYSEEPRQSSLKTGCASHVSGAWA